MLQNINLKKNGSINYSEFIASTMKIKKHLNNAKMKALFRHFDIDSSGRISKQNLSEVFMRAGKKVS